MNRARRAELQELLDKDAEPTEEVCDCGTVIEVVGCDDGSAVFLCRGCETYWEENGQ